MGPFKHTVDDGLDLRKAAFECMYTLLDSCLDRIDIFTFLNHVEDGLKDHYDIKVAGALRPSSFARRRARLTRSVALADADLPHAGPPVLALSQRRPPEVGPTGRASQGHLHHQGATPHTHTHTHI